MLCLVAWGRTWASGRVDTDLLERALELAQGSPAAFAFAACTYGVLLGMSYENEPARELLLSVRALGPGVDDERLAEALGGKPGRVEWAAGNWERLPEKLSGGSRATGRATWQ